MDAYFLLRKDVIVLACKKLITLNRLAMDNASRVVIVTADASHQTSPDQT